MPRVNPAQRWTLIAAAVVAAIFQLLWFSHNGVSGNGWVLTLVVVVILLFVALSSDEGTSLTRDGSAVSTVSSQPATSSEEVATQKRALEPVVNANLSLVNRVSDEVALEVTAGLSCVQTNRGTMADEVAAVGRTTFVLYSLGLFLICRLRHNGAYLATQEYRATRRQLLVECVSHDAQLLGGSNLAPDRAKLAQAIHTDVLQVETSVRAFAAALAQGNTSSPASALNSWFDQRTGAAGVLGGELHSFTRDKLRSMYHAVYRLPEAE